MEVMLIILAYIDLGLAIYFFTSKKYNDAILMFGLFFMAMFLYLGECLTKIIRAI